MDAVISPKDVFDIWVPESDMNDEKSPQWTKWAKPVLFSQIKPFHFTPPVSESLKEVDLSWVEGFNPKPAIIVDVPGAESVYTGLKLAVLGYRPVPLFNGCAHPTKPEIVSTNPIIYELIKGVDILKNIKIPADAPPAFLLDSNRLSGKAFVQPGRFDNRWVALPQDFPSANYILSKHIDTAVIIKPKIMSTSDNLFNFNATPSSSSDVYESRDLSHILYRWQQAGVKIMKYTQGEPPPVPVLVNKPKGFKSIWHRMMIMSGLIVNSAGGFGGIVPDVSSGS